MQHGDCGCMHAHMLSYFGAFLMALSTNSAFLAALLSTYVASGRFLNLSGSRSLMSGQEPIGPAPVPSGAEKMGETHTSRRTRGAPSSLAVTAVVTGCQALSPGGVIPT